MNPYLALAAMIAGGLHGIEQELPLEDELEGNAYTSGRRTVPDTLAEAREAFAASEVARRAFGDDVVDHYTNMADVELRAFRGRRHRLGAAPRLREAVMTETFTVLNPATATAARPRSR